jgi:DNA-binding response OmpR family regulator
MELTEAETVDKGKKIILIEDDEFLGRVYERAFRFAGYEVQLVNNGQMALDLFAAGLSPLPAAIVSDIILPSVNGYDVLVGIRKDARYETVPVIILTNSFAEHENIRFLDAGADAYLVKIENESKQIVEKIGEIINTGRASKPTPAIV